MLLPAEVPLFPTPMHQARVLQQIQLHMELTRLLHSARLLPQERAAVDPHKLLALWDYEGSLAAQVRG